MLARWQRLGQRSSATPLLSLVQPVAGSVTLDYLAHDPLKQPDQTSCGSASLVVAQMLGDADYARRIIVGPGAPLVLESTQQRFAEAALQMHQRTNAVTAADAALQIPWPKGLGTLPWAAARQLGSFVMGVPYRVLIVDPKRPADAFGVLVAAVRASHACPIYVGDELSPRHVVLAVAVPAADALTIYEPSSGLLQDWRQDEFDNRSSDIAGWNQPWLAVVPG
jgi:hypothetical protein